MTTDHPTSDPPSDRPQTEWWPRRREFIAGVGATAALSGAWVGPALAQSTDDGGDSTVTLVEADPEAGFNYPYFLYTPDRENNEPRPLLVEPNNSGGATDDFQAHRELARMLIEDHWPKTLSDELGVPLLVPVFPRPRSEPVDLTHYVHALDANTMRITDGELARVDLQLRAMVDHAKVRLADRSYAVADRIALDGFSATGNFVNRFTALHPDLVTSVTAGAVNGTAVLPIEEAKGHTLNYHIGIADLESVTGEPFDRERWVEVDQYVYMGAEDDNDTIPEDVGANDAWTEQQVEVALDVYGEDMQEDRMPYCESVYDEAGASSEFRIYDGIGHEVADEMIQDVIDFHDQHMMDGATAETPAATANPEDGGSSAGGSGPGFGLGGGLAGLAGAYALHRLTGDDSGG